MLTTHRILFYVDADCFEILLCKVDSFEKAGGLMATSGLKINLHEGNSLLVRFHDKNRDRFLEYAIVGLKSRQWEHLDDSL